jgi:hypothetical protein
MLLLILMGPFKVVRLKVVRRSMRARSIVLLSSSVLPTPIHTAGRPDRITTRLPPHGRLERDAIEDEVTIRWKG